MPTTVIPCSLHSVAAATKTTVKAMGAQTEKKNNIHKLQTTYNNKHFHLYTA